MVLRSAFVIVVVVSVWASMLVICSDQQSENNGSIKVLIQDDSRLHNYLLLLELTPVKLHLERECCTFSVIYADRNLVSVIPPGTHYYWVDTGIIEWEVCLTFYSQVVGIEPQTLGSCVCFSIHSTVFFLRLSAAFTDAYRWSRVQYYSTSIWSYIVVVRDSDVMSILTLRLPGPATGLSGSLTVTVA